MLVLCVTVVHMSVREDGRRGGGARLLSECHENTCSFEKKIKGSGKDQCGHVSFYISIT